MSAENPKDVVAKKLTRELLKKQLDESRRSVSYAQQAIEGLNQQLQQQQGIINFVEHMLKQFDIPSEPKDPLEVK